jgi:hypothetical protein
MVAREERWSWVRFLGSASKPRWSWCRVEAHNQTMDTGFGWFTPQNQLRAATTWWPSHEWDLAWRLHRVCGVYDGSPQNHQGYLVEPQNQDWRLGRRRRDPGVPRSFEAGDTRHDRGACVGRTRTPDGCAAVRWRTSCVDQNAPVRAWVVTPSVGVLRSFPEGLYIGGGGWMFNQLFG